MKVLLPSVAQNGRLAYPLLGEVTDRDMRGRKSHGRPVYYRNSGGSNLGGEQIYGPEDKQIIAASSIAHTEIAVWILPSADRFMPPGRPLFCGKKWVSAPQKRAGVRIQARRERFTEITPGRSYFQQGLTATCKDQLLRVIQGGGRI